MRVLVCGGRRYANTRALHGALNALHAARRVTCVIQDVPVESYPADWKRHGKGAGPIRNRLMLRVGRPDLVLATTGGNGTAHMVNEARKAGVPVQLVGDA